ncbi:sensor histidine kinase [Nocardiopsis coralliicola]
MTVRALLAMVPVVTLACVAAVLGIQLQLDTVQTERVSQVARTVAAQWEQGRGQDPIPVEHGVLRIQAVDRDGRVIGASAAMQGRAALSTKRPTGGDFRVEDIRCPDALGLAQCLRIVGITVDTPDQGPVIVYAAVVDSERAQAVWISAGIAALGGVTLAAFGALVWWSTGRTLRPVERIRSELERLSTSDLRQRLTVPATGDEIDDLARTANTTLDRMQAALDRQRAFVSDASHELRTPIAGMRTRVEVEISEPELGGEEARRALRGVLSDVDRLEQLVDDLLALARLESDRSESVPVDLAELARNGAGAVPWPHPVQTDLAGGAVVDGNPVALERLLTNLIANAERHARGRVRGTVARTPAKDGGEAVLEVHDDGAGIPVEQRERIFERFARLAESRRRDPGGSGLGLAISRGVAEAHGGTLTAGESPLLGGAVLVLRLPATEAGADPAPGGDTEGEEAP